MLNRISPIIILLVALPQIVIAQDLNLDSWGASKSRGRALGFSAAATALPVSVALLLPRDSHDNGRSLFNKDVRIGLAFGGLILGPGVGHLYAHQRRRHMIGSMVRLLAVTSVVTGWTMTHSQYDSDGISPPPPWEQPIDASNERHERTGSIFIGVGAAVYLASSIYDFATVGKSVDEFNREQAANCLQFRPTYSSQDGAFGIKLSLVL